MLRLCAVSGPGGHFPGACLDALRRLGDPGAGRGVIGVRVERAEPELARVTLWDDGRGLPAGRSSGTGLRLIEGLVRQVKGAPEWSGSPGTRLVITVPVRSDFD